MAGSGLHHVMEQKEVVVPKVQLRYEVHVQCTFVVLTCYTPLHLYMYIV